MPREIKFSYIGERLYTVCHAFIIVEAKHNAVFVCLSK